EWLRDTEGVVRKWAEANRPTNPEHDRQPPAGRRGRVGRPRLEDDPDPTSRARFNLYRLIANRRHKAKSRSALAELLNAERDVRELARDAGFPKGVTVGVVRSAEQFARDRADGAPAENTGA